METKSRKPTRLQKYDYGQPGYYFVTICVQDRICCLGNLINGEMVLNYQGKIVQNSWLDLPNHYPNSSLDEYIVMPNHFHGILIVFPVGEGFKPSPTKAHGMSEIIRGFKTFSSRKINNLGQINFHWQRSFYDHVIRKAESLDKIREYIRTIPNNGNWTKKTRKILKYQLRNYLAPKAPRAQALSDFLFLFAGVLVKAAVLEFVVA